MTSNYPRFMLAAPKSGSGKTIITCGILKLFSDLGISCRAYKCGPDYIDPLFHKFVQGIDGGNLDTWFQPESQLLSQFMEISQGASVSVVEGVMGYYDGMGGNTTTASSYEVARVLDCPVILILDCRGASLSLSAVAKGFLEYREDSRIKGVILNRISRSMVPRLTVEMEKLGLPVLGWVEECKEAVLESRHLGLVLPQEQSRLEKELETFALRIKESLDVERILKLAGSASSLTLPEKETGKKQEKKEKRKIKIGVALDEAFCFYYQENLRLLEKLGAKLVPFSPLKDENLPEGVCGIIFGGGYPELHGCELGENLQIGYFEQEVKGENTNTCIDELWAEFPSYTQYEVRSALAKCGLTTKHIESQVRVLSGGEQAKVRLCKLLNRETNILLLDEPTNHLDVDAKDALKQALLEYRGSVLLICHEPEFYQDIVSEIWDCTKWTTKII